MPVYADSPTSYIYEIQIEGRLSPERAEWLGLDADVQRRPDGVVRTHLVGPLPDQAALFGVLSSIRDLGLGLVSVRRVEAVETCGGSLGLAKEAEDGRS